MPISNSDKTELLERLNALLKQQSLFQQEINELQREITLLQTTEPRISEPAVPEEEHTDLSTELIDKTEHKYKKREPKKSSRMAEQWQFKGISTELEKFIGENLINKIGIAVLIIGVSIGVKYAIDNDLISPLVRIILGYLVGAILTFFGMRLKAKYLNFSAVLHGGAMAIYYFITYAATSYYNLFPQSVAVGLMILITVLTVALALWYNRQVIAHFGLAGAYLIPYILKDPFAQVASLFIYMVIINAGILYISTRKMWKPLNYFALAATWVIFLSWFGSGNYNDQLGIHLTFSSLFFLLFYLVFLSYKLQLKEKLKEDDILFLLANSGIYYLSAMIAIYSLTNNSNYLSLFSFCNALVHGATAYLVFKQEKKSKTLLSWNLGLVIFFVTIAMPYLLNNEVNAIVWGVEAALIFWLGRTKKIIAFDYFSGALIICTLFQIIFNWNSVFINFNKAAINALDVPFINIQFLSSLMVIASFAFILTTSLKYESQLNKKGVWMEMFSLFQPLSLITVIFFTFFTEISLLWNNIQVHSSYALNSEGIWEKTISGLNQDIENFKYTWLINYSLVFASLMAFVNFKWVRSQILNEFVTILCILLALIFLTGGLSGIDELRNSYLINESPGNYNVTIFHLLIRYISYLFFGGLCVSVSRFSISLYPKQINRKIFEIAISVFIIWICSNELIHWLVMSGTTEVYRHGLSILWGILSFILIGYGIWKKKKHLRITSIVLFGITLIKLFFYDLSNLETVPKTIVFVSTGALLLVVSFMYNKYRDIIFGND